MPPRLHDLSCIRCAVYHDSAACAIFELGVPVVLKEGQKILIATNVAETSITRVALRPHQAHGIPGPVFCDAGQRHAATRTRRTRSARSGRAPGRSCVSHCFSLLQYSCNGCLCWIIQLVVVCACSYQYCSISFFVGTIGFAGDFAPISATAQAAAARDASRAVGANLSASQSLGVKFCISLT